MTKVKDDYNLSDVIKKVSEYIEPTDLIERSFNFVSKYQIEESSKHLLNVAYILTSLQADQETIAASFLYHLFVNNLVTTDEIINNFDKNISRLSFGIYKLNKISFSTENDYLIEYYKKVIVGMSEDVRVIIVALSERVYLMRSLPELSNVNEKEIAKETLEIFAPIAHHLGVYRLKSELEDLSLRYLKPDVYYDIVDKLNSTKSERDELINEMIKEVTLLLKEHGIHHEIKGRSKSIYSIYNKLDKGRKFSDIYDLLALRILVDDESECYLVLGLIHSKFKPIAKRFKDFIAMPKSNGYQSLHTTVFGVDNELYEIQIRTFEMNEVAENGLAAHWSYKEHRNAYNLSNTDAKLEFFKAVIDMNNKNENAYNSVQEDMLDDNIYVFTPKGDVIELPKGSTPVDFAFRVHTKVGEEMIGCLVNNQIVPLNYILQDSDVVKINTSKNSNGPKEDWLNFVKLTATKNKIKAYFSKNRKEDLINKGKELIDKELRKRKIVFNDFYSDKNEKTILKQLKEPNMETLYLDIASNKYTAKYIIDLIYKTEEENVLVKNNIIRNKLDINVSGIKDVKVNIASCCLPLPGDEIIGYITKNNGITVHRKSCSNVIHLNDRIIDVSFNPITKNTYLTRINIVLKNNINRLGDILNKLSMKNINIDEVKTIYGDNIIYQLSFYINNLDHLNAVIADLNKLRYVKETKREE